MTGKASRYIWHNGRLVPWEDATVHVLSHGLHYGSSVFEGIRVYGTPRGPMGFRLGDHLTRMYNSAKLYRIDIPYSGEEITAACHQAAVLASGQPRITSAPARNRYLAKRFTTMIIRSRSILVELPAPALEPSPPSSLHAISTSAAAW